MYAAEACCVPRHFSLTLYLFFSTGQIVVVGSRSCRSLPSPRSEAPRGRPVSATRPPARPPHSSFLDRDLFVVFSMSRVESGFALLP